MDASAMSVSGEVQERRITVKEVEVSMNACGEKCMWRRMYVEKIRQYILHKAYKNKDKSHALFACYNSTGSGIRTYTRTQGGSTDLGAAGSVFGGCCTGTSRPCRVAERRAPVIGVMPHARTDSE